jgi:hypothetical protein
VEFTQLVNEHLASLAVPFNKELEAYLSHPFSAATKFHLFEYDSQHFSDDFAVCVFPMGDDGEAVGEGHWFLEGDAVVVPESIYLAERFEEIEPWVSATDICESWLVKQFAALNQMRISVFLGHHDSYFKCDMTTGEQITWDKIIEKCGG